MSHHHDVDLAAALHEKELRDHTAYRGLSPLQKTIAKTIASGGFYIRYGIGWGGFYGLRRIEGGSLWLIDKLKKVAKPIASGIKWFINAPFQLAKSIGALIPASLKGAVRAITGGVSAALTGGIKFLNFFKNPDAQDGLISRIQARLTRARTSVREAGERWRSYVDAGWNKVRGFGRDALHWIDNKGSVGIYRLGRWAFIPTRTNGDPLFKSDMLNKGTGFALSSIGFVGTVAGLVLLKEQAAHHVGALFMELKSAPLTFGSLSNFAMTWAGVSVVVKGGGFAMLPVIAAARKGLKNNAFTQGIAHAYTQKLKMATQRDRYVKTRPEPLAFVGSVIAHVVDASVPEKYEIRCNAKSSFASATDGKPRIQPSQSAPKHTQGSNGPRDTLHM